MKDIYEILAGSADGILHKEGFDNSGTYVVENPNENIPIQEDLGEINNFIEYFGLDKY